MGQHHRYGQLNQRRRKMNYIMREYITKEECLQLVKKCVEYIDKLPEVDEVIYVANAAKYSYDIMKILTKRKNIFNDLYIDCKSYKGTKLQVPVIVGQSFEPDLIRDKTVVLYDTILDTATTFSACVRHLLEMRVGRIYPCFMFERSTRQYGFERFTAKVIGDEFIVGWGLDFDGKYRNIDMVYKLEEVNI
jgi:hypoxanthine phosphoribosyltransferase